MEDSSSNMSFKSEGSSDVSVSDTSIMNIPENDPYITKQIQEEERQMKRKLKAQRETERKALKKQMELEERQQRKERAIKGMTFLLSKSQLYSKFLGDKLASHLNDDEELKNEILKGKENVPVKDNLNEIPKYFTGGTLRPYQVEGLTWLRLLFENGINGILADEMGLGKTIQVIALIAYLYEKNINGPYLIIAPLSVTTNWMTEFKKFTPKLPVVFFHGDEHTRKKIRHKIADNYEIDGKLVKPIVVTTYQVVVREKKFLEQFKWGYIILDEAQNIKNSESQRYMTIDNFRSLNRLLLTGTPLQNNLIELWALLHFLMPNIFGKKTDTAFTSVLNLEDFKSVNATVEDDKIKNIIATIHGVINPFLLRRLKQDVLADIVPKKELVVFCPLSDMQRTLTKYVLERNLSLLAGKQEDVIDVNAPRAKRKCSLNRQNYAEISGKDFEQDNDDDVFIQENFDVLSKLTKKNKQTKDDGVQIIRSVNLATPFMALREIANHPYLLHMPTVKDSKGKPMIKIDENLIKTSGKMRVLDALLKRLKVESHKVLIFSCFTMMLDIVEEYLIYQDYKYARFDGSYDLEERNIEIKKFCQEMDTFVFLITTRSGGVGLNLVEADTVIFMDLDFNPQADIQAQDRCHRIGQTKPVVIYKLVSLGTIDEKILRGGEMKRRLEKVIIKNGRLNQSNYKNLKNLNKEELLQLLKSVETTNEIHSTGSNRSALTKSELDELLDRSDLYKQLDEQLTKIKNET